MGCDAGTSFQQTRFTQCENTVLLQTMGHTERIQTDSIMN